jgi:hypothetical protein
MKRIHPNLGKAAVLAVMVWIASAAGCRSRSGTIPSPFLAPDRVPPPATRTLLPGQAQPYYPGDPLPVMQSATGTPAAKAATTSLVSSPQPTSESGLAWSAPGAVARSAPADNMLSSAALARSNEPAVAVPADDDSLRFAVPAAEPAVIAQATRTAPQEPQAIVQAAAAPQPRAVVPASYHAPITESSQRAVVEASAGSIAQTAAASPWRPPRITQSDGRTTIGAAPATVLGVPPLAPRPNSIDVRLRAVPSPPPESLESTTPRIRLPSHSTSQPIGRGSVVGQTAPFFVTTIPATNLASSPAAPISPDGFRARGSMR